MFLLLAATLGCGRTHFSGPDAATASVDASVVTCDPPDVLVVLDRTASMAERPDGTLPADTPAGHAQSKWFIAINAVESLSARLDTTIRFGLALFPRAPAGAACITLAQKLSGATASNPQCQAGEVLVEPDAATAAAIDTTLDPETTRLCTSTPIGAGLATARTELAAVRDPAREQYVLFVGDGADSCDAPLALANTDALARDGVKTFVVAFDQGAGVDAGMLDDMACAGGTAPSFPAGCTQDASGNYRASNRSGPALFLLAGNGAALTTAFEQIAGSVCCGCIL